MRPERNEWWQAMSIARRPIPTGVLLTVTLVLAGLLVVTIIFNQGPRPLPAAKSGVNPVPTASGQFIYSPRSASIRQGIPYRFTLYTHCGLEWPLAADFDGSYWDLNNPDATPSESGSPPPGFGNPVDHGVMTLTSASLAEYHSQGGKTIQFRRHPGARVASPCF